MSPAQIGAFRRGEIVIAHLSTGESYARVLRATANRRGLIVDIGGAPVVVAAARRAPKAVQP